MTAGDEFGRSQQGNNNAYAQDNAITWIDWNNRDRALEDFVAELAAFRADNPRLWESDFLTEAGWFDLDGAPLTTQSWQDGELAGFELHIPGSDGAIIIRIDRRSRTCTARRERADVRA